MKNVLVVLLLLAAALGVYKLTRGRPQADPTVRTADGRPTQPLDSRRPVLPEGSVQPEGLPPGVVAHLSEDAARRLQQEREFPWKDTVTEETLVPLEDAWRVDLSGVDFEAEVLCTVNGEPIRREDFRRRMVLDHGQIAIRARLLHEMGRRVAAATGQPFGITDEQFQSYLESFAKASGLDVEQAKLQLSHSTKLPVDGALVVRRQMIEGILALYPPVEFAEQLPEEVRRSVTNPDDLENVLEVSAVFADLRAQFNDPEKSGQFSGAVEIMIMLAKGTFEDDLLRRYWTSMDAELPDGAVAAYATGPLPMSPTGVPEFLPPWALPGEPALLPTDELFALFGEVVSRHVQETVLDELIWSAALRQRLGAEGALPDPERSWMMHAAEYVAGRKAALSAGFLIGLEGFTSEAHYRENLRFRTGFAESRPEGWDDEDALRAFFDDHRFFIQVWQPDLSIAHFPPYDPESDDYATVDWELAMAKAQAFYEAVSAAPETFDAALETHYRELSERLRTGRGEYAAQALLSDFELGRVDRAVTQVDALLHESEVEQDLRATSVVRNAVVRLEKGEIGPPWRTPIGYVVVRLNNARLSKLEDEFEDLEPATREQFTRTHFRLWVDETMKAAQVEVQ